MIVGLAVGDNTSLRVDRQLGLTRSIRRGQSVSHGGHQEQEKRAERVAWRWPGAGEEGRACHMEVTRSRRRGQTMSHGGHQEQEKRAEHVAWRSPGAGEEGRACRMEVTRSMRRGQSMSHGGHHEHKKRTDHVACQSKWIAEDGRTPIRHISNKSPRTQQTLTNKRVSIVLYNHNGLSDHYRNHGASAAPTELLLDLYSASISRGQPLMVTSTSHCVVENCCHTDN